MADINYKKLLQVISATALLLGGLALTGCASAPEHKAAEGAAKGAKQEAAGSGQGEASQGAKSGGQSNAASSEASGGGGESAKAAAKTAPPKAEPKPDISGTDVTAIENKMKHFPRVLWHSHTNTYRFYVGTVLFAEYSPYDETFMVMTDNGDQKNLVCKYAPGKGWKVEGKSKGETCKTLLREMNDFLTHPYS